MNILENYKQTLRISNNRITKHRSIMEEENKNSEGNGKTFDFSINKKDEEVTGNSHITNFLKANKEKQNKDVMSQVDRVDNGIDRISKVLEKLRKIIQELKHSYMQSEMPRSEPTGDASGASRNN